MKISYPTLSLAWRVRQAALEELLPRHFNRQAGNISCHSDGSFVTEADLAMERRLIDAAKITHPHALATGEETIAEDPRAFLENAKDKEVIINDPLDGTGAFLEGLDIYAAVSAVIQNGVTKAGIIYSPGLAIQQADGRLVPQKDMTFIVESGQGCWMYRGTDTDNAVQLKIGKRATSLSHEARVAFACRNQDKKFEAILADGVDGYMERRHANHDYIRLLTGEADATFYAEGFMPNGVGKCPPWDHAAGILMLEEAGGYVALPYGEVSKGGQKYDPLICHSSLLVAANRQLFDDMMKHVAERAPELCQPR